MDIILIYSGGLDSTTLLYSLRAEGHAVAALSLDYGQRHRCELLAAQSICSSLSLVHHLVDLSCLRPLLAGSSQTDATVPVPHGHYTDTTMKATVVPNRNMLMLAVAGAWAMSRKADAVAYAAHSGDHAIYPDCRASFVQAMARALVEADWHTVTLLAPFLDQTKADIVRLGSTLAVPFAETWSCYDPQADAMTGRLTHCGRCGTCWERRESFTLAGVADPTEYAYAVDAR